MSTVYCVIPVHNRVNATKRCLECLSEQDYADVHVVIIDDGSTDGTSEFLSAHLTSRLTVIDGDGNLWWGGAMRVGIDFVLKNAANSDYLLMLNDDVLIEANYIRALVQDSRTHNNAMVGSVLCDEKTGVAAEFGIRVEYLNMTISPVTRSELARNVNALPGRGVLIPIGYVRLAGNISSYFFSHYFGDIEYTARIYELGCSIVVCEEAKVFASLASSDSHVRSRGVMHRYFAWNSKDNLVHRIIFFSIRGPWVLRLTALPRYLIFGMWRSLCRLLLR